MTGRTLASRDARTLTESTRTAREQPLSETDRARLRSIYPRVLTALQRAADSAKTGDEQARQIGCIELWWDCDDEWTQAAESELNETLMRYSSGDIEPEKVGAVLNQFIDAHRVRWSRGIAVVYERGT